MKWNLPRISQWICLSLNLYIKNNARDLKGLKRIQLLFSIDKMPPMDAEKRKEYNRQYYLKNKEERKLKDKKYREKNKERYKEQNKQYYLENKEKLLNDAKSYYVENKDTICDRMNDYYRQNKDKVSERGKIYRFKNKCPHSIALKKCKDCSISTYLVYLQRSRLKHILKSTTLNKTKSTIEYLDCSPEYFKEYLQKKMADGMTFDNIHIDHIKPVCKFNLEDPEELLKCCHYTNMQPLLASVNLSKNGKWSDKDDAFWNKNIIHKEYLPLYLPK
jgi:hypothetical protein